MAATNVESLTNPRDSLPNSYQASIAAREIDFVTRFGSNWDALRTILGVMRPIRKAPGTTLSQVKATVALESGSVDEGEVIPYSKTSFTKVAFEDLTIEKYAKAVTIEEVNKYGADVAIEKSDEAFLNQLQTHVMTEFFAFLNAGTGATKDSTTTWQKALALAKAGPAARIGIANAVRGTAYRKAALILSERLEEARSSTIYPDGKERDIRKRLFENEIKTLDEVYALFFPPEERPDAVVDYSDLTWEQAVEDLDENVDEIVAPYIADALAQTDD